MVDPSEFLVVVLVHLLAVASPGPDFFLIFRQSITHGRRTALWSSLGIGAGIAVHIVLSLAGVALLLAQSPRLFLVVRFVGAAYLAWLGVRMLRSSRFAGRPAPSQDGPAAGPVPSERGAFALGFLTNALNPKATLFFLAVFSVILSPTTQLPAKLIYGGWMIAATAGWFAGLSILLSHQNVRAFFQRFAHWFERAMGAILIALGLRLVLVF